MLESLGLVPQSSNTKFICSKEGDGEVMFIEIIRDDDKPQNESPNDGEGTTIEGPTIEYFNTFPTRDKLTYDKYLMSSPIPSIFLRNPIIMEGCPSNLKIPCNIGHVHIKKSYIDLNSPLNIMTRIMYNWIMRRKLNPREDASGGVSNFIVYHRNEEDKKRGVEYVVSKKLGFYKECLKLGPEYLTGVDDEGEVTLYLMRRSLEVLRKFHWMILEGRFNQLSHVSSPLLSKPREY
ncbi:hypothetical protein Tco_0994881 [Tanacetum coccineum]